MSGTPLRDKLAFGSPDLAITLLFATVNGWLLYYLVTVINLPRYGQARFSLQAESAMDC